MMDTAVPRSSNDSFHLKDVISKQLYHTKYIQLGSLIMFCQESVSYSSE